MTTASSKTSYPLTGKGLKKAYDDANNVKDLFENAAGAGDIYERCEAAGASDCGARATLCFLFDHFGGGVRSNLAYGGYAESLYRHYCLGEPVLKCCLTESGCHSAFNSPAPINCEGNPHYGPTSTAGFCKRPCSDNNCAGCVCNYIPECRGPPDQRALTEGDLSRLMQEEPNLFGDYDRMDFHLTRMDNFVNNMGYVMTGANTEESVENWTVLETVSTTLRPGSTLSVTGEILDFLFYRGCDSFSHNLRLLADAVPPLIPKDYRGRVQDRPGDLMDQVPALEPQKAYFAIARLALDIPQFWLRIDYINSLYVTDDDVNAMLEESGVANPEVELLKYVDYGGLQILYLSLGHKWRLVAIPVDESQWKNTTEPTSMYPPEEGLQSCVEGNGRGSATTVSEFAVSVDSASASLELEIDGGQGDVYVSVYWGDHSEIEEDQLGDDSSSLSATHQYTTCGTMRVIVQLTNSAGLFTLIVKQAEVPCGVDVSEMTDLTAIPYPNVARVHLEMSMEKAGNRYGGAGDQVMYFQGTAESETNTTILSNPNSTAFSVLGHYVSYEIIPNDQQIFFNLTFDWTGELLRAIRFTCRTIDHYVHTAGLARVQGVKLELFTGDLVEVRYEGPEDGTRCARRGDVREDTQTFGIVFLGSTENGTLIDNEDSEDVISPIFSEEGFYYEVYPGRYKFSSSLSSSQTSGPVAFCFPSDSMVEIKDQGLGPIWDVEIGDHVRVAGGKFESVYAFGHRSRDLSGEFVSLQHGEMNEVFRSSPDHMVYTVEKGPIAASQVRIGDSLVGGNGSSSLVTDVKHSPGIGAYAPFTPSGSIVVDGIVASNYITFNLTKSKSIKSVPHWLMHVLMSPFRLAHHVGIMRVDYNEDGVAGWVEWPLAFAERLSQQQTWVFLLIVIPLFLISCICWSIELFLI